MDSGYSSKKIIVFVLLTLNTYYLILTTSLPTPAFAQCPDTGCEAAGIIQVQQLMTRLINISTTIAFMALTIWLVWGALKFFITSGGDPKALAQAWSSVTWGFLGLFFMVLAYLALRLIFAVTGADVTQFCLGFPPYCLDNTFPVFTPGGPQ